MKSHDLAALLSYIRSLRRIAWNVILAAFFAFDFRNLFILISARYPIFCFNGI